MKFQFKFVSFLKFGFKFWVWKCCHCVKKSNFLLPFVLSHEAQRSCWKCFWNLEKCVVMMILTNDRNYIIIHNYSETIFLWAQNRIPKQKSIWKEYFWTSIGKSNKLIDRKFNQFIFVHSWRVCDPKPKPSSYLSYFQFIKLSSIERTKYLQINFGFQLIHFRNNSFHTNNYIHHS